MHLARGVLYINSQSPKGKAINTETFLLHSTGRVAENMPLLANPFAVMLPLHDITTMIILVSLICRLLCIRDVWAVLGKDTPHRTESVMDETEKCRELDSIKGYLFQLDYEQTTGRISPIPRAMRILSMHQTNSHQQ